MAKENPLVRRLRDWQSHRADEKLFRHLARTHELDSDEIEQLVAIADHFRLVRLSEIFLRPSLLRGHSVTEGPSLLQQRQLAKKIFGEVAAT